MTASAGGAAGEGGTLWAITSYFNPSGSRRRLQNYRAFRSRLGAPLAAIELSFGADFELAPGDADLLLQRRGGAVLWQKERLLNVLLEALPSTCVEVAWIDSDVVFERGDWPQRTHAALEHAGMVQLFHQVHHVAANAGAARIEQADRLSSNPSATGLLAAGATAEEVFSRPTNRGEGAPSLGMAWAASRALLRRHGFYDASVVGGGDTAMVCAAVGRPEFAVEKHRMNARQRDRYLAWAAGFGRDVGRPGIAGLDSDIFHLWHGALANRRSRLRHAGLAPYDFDPGTDIAIGPSGAWEWASDKPGLHRYLADYFSARKEDG